MLPRARGAAAKEIQDAEAYRLQVLALAQGETSRFEQVLQQYQKAPKVTRERMYIDTLENVYKSARKVIVDTKGNGNILYLPLDKIMPAAGAVPAQSAPSEPQAVPAQPADVSQAEDARTRGIR